MKQVDHLAGNLMLPYVIWVAFANLLNFVILRNNSTTIVEPLRDNSPKGIGGSKTSVSSYALYWRNSVLQSGAISVGCRLAEQNS